MKNKLKHFQIEGVNFLITHRHALLADEMGLGKTIQAIAAINVLAVSRVLILCPASVKIYWSRKLKEWLDVPRSIFIVRKGNDEIPNVNIIICNYDLLLRNRIQKQLRLRRYNIGICDEVHYLKGIQAKRTKNVLGAKGIIRQCDYKYMLTGTPVLNRPIELYPILKVLAQEIIAPYDTYIKYAYQFCGAYQDDYALNVRGNSNLDDLKYRLSKFMLRRLKEQVLSELPERIYEKITLTDINIKHVLEQENQLTEEQKEMIEAGGIDMGQLSTLRRVTGMAKVFKVLEFIKNTLEKTNKVIVFAHHKAVINLLMRDLKKYKPVQVVGGMHGDAKQRAVDKFVNDSDCRVFIGNILSAGVGLDGLQKCANVVIFGEISWVPGEIMQAVDRAHRIGQLQSVLIYFLLAEGTIEDQMFDTVLRKIKIVKQITE